MISASWNPRLPNYARSERKKQITMTTQDNLTILVTGATGFVGRGLCNALFKKGHDYIALSRAPAVARAQLPHAKRIEAWRPDAEPTPPSALSNTRAVVHLVGEPIAGKWNAEKKRRIRESRVISTHRLIESLSEVETKPSVLVSASAIGFYGEGGDNKFTEDSPPGNDFLAELCQAWEAEAQRAEALGIRVVLVRIGLVLGKAGGVLPALLTPFRMGLGGKIGSGEQWMSWVHLDDVIGIILHALENSQISGQLNATTSSPVKNIEFTKKLGGVLKRPTFFPVPTFALKLRYGEFADFVLMSQRVLPEKTLSSGYEFRHTNLESTLRASLE